MGAAEIVLNVVFYVLAASAIAGAVAVAASRNIVRSAFALLAVLFSVAGLYAVMKADFIAGAQVLIYVGGILVLIIFAVMLTHRITDVKLSNDSTPGPAAFCACLCLLFSLLVVVRYSTKWRRDSDTVTARAESFEVSFKQYQADGATGLAFGGGAYEDSVVVVATVSQGPDPLRILDQVQFVATSGANRVSRNFPVAGRDAPYRHVFEKLSEGEWRWTVRLLGRQKDGKDEVDREWEFPLANTGFTVTRGVTEPIALALAGPYLFAFEVVLVLLLAALVGAAFLARKEV